MLINLMAVNFSGFPVARKYANGATTIVSKTKTPTK